MEKFDDWALFPSLYASLCGHDQLLSLLQCISKVMKCKRDAEADPTEKRSASYRAAVNQCCNSASKPALKLRYQYMSRLPKTSPLKYAFMLVLSAGIGKIFTEAPICEPFRRQFEAPICEPFRRQLYRRKCILFFPLFSLFCTPTAVSVVESWTNNLAPSVTSVGHLFIASSLLCARVVVCHLSPTQGQIICVVVAVSNNQPSVRRGHGHCIKLAALPHNHLVKQSNTLNINVGSARAKCWRP